MLKQRIIPGCLLVVLTLVLGCSSRSSGGTATIQGCSTHYGATCNTGFYIVIYDAPIEQIDEFRVTFTEVELVSGEDSFAFFSGERRVDLLSFAERGFLLASREDVPTATFDKIRFHVTDVELVPPPRSGIQPDLPDGGYIEIDLFEPVTTAEGLLHGVSVDFDVPNSLYFDEAGEIQIDPLLIPTTETGEVAVAALRAVVVDKPERAGPVRVELADGSGERTLYSDDTLPADVAAGDWIELTGWMHPDRTIDVEDWVAVESGEPELRPVR